MEMDEGNPQRLVDWLIVQHTCEWCGGTIDHPCNANGDVYLLPPKWRCREVKRNGYTSKHWKYWRICSTCNAKDFAGFSKWIFPVIKSIMPEHESLSAIMAVQPMGQPSGEIMYMDYIHGPDRREGQVRGRTQDCVMIDDAGPAVRPEHAQAYAQQQINPANYTMLEYKITPDGVERKINAPSGVFKL